MNYNITYLNITSITIVNNLNLLSSNSILSINNLNNTSTTIYNNLNLLSANSTLSLYIHSLQMTTTSCLSINCTSYGVMVNIVNNGACNDGVNYTLNVTGYSMFGGVQINGEGSKYNIYKNV